MSQVDFNTAVTNLMVALAAFNAAASEQIRDAAVEDTTKNKITSLRVMAIQMEPKLTEVGAQA